MIPPAVEFYRPQTIPLQYTRILAEEGDGGLGVGGYRTRGATRIFVGG